MAMATTRGYPIRAGYVEKQGGGTSRFGGTAWKKRWLVLESGHMLYFETREDYESNKPPLKDSRVALAEYSIYRAGEADLVVQPADETHGRKFCLRCPTRREADVWIQWFAEHGCERGVPPTVAAARHRSVPGAPDDGEEDEPLASRGVAAPAPPGGSGGRAVPLFGGGDGAGAGAPATYAEPAVNPARAPIRSGYIEKLGGGTSTLGRHSWKKRFFVLEAGHMSYFNSAEDYMMGERAVKDAWVDVGAYTVDRGRERGDLLLVHSSGSDSGATRTWQLRCHTEEYANMWLGYFREHGAHVAVPVLSTRGPKIPVRTGYLDKQGGGTSVAGKANWKRRFVVLDEGNMAYYENAAEFEAGTGPKKGARIALAPYVLNRIGDCGIQLVNPRERDARRWEMWATSDADANRWVTYFLEHGCAPGAGVTDDFVARARSSVSAALDSGPPAAARGGAPLAPAGIAAPTAPARPAQPAAPRPPAASPGAAGAGAGAAGGATPGRSPAPAAAAPSAAAMAFRVPVQLPIYAGYVEKMGGGTSLLGRKGFKRRYIVVEAMHLMYYESAEEFEGTAAAKKMNRIALSEHYVSRVARNEVQLVPTSGAGGDRVWHFRMATSEDTDAWIAHFMEHGAKSDVMRR